MGGTPTTPSAPFTSQAPSQITNMNQMPIQGAAMQNNVNVSKAQNFLSQQSTQSMSHLQAQLQGQTQASSASSTLGQLPSQGGSPINIPTSISTPGAQPMQQNGTMSRSQTPLAMSPTASSPVPQKQTTQGGVDLQPQQLLQQIQQRQRAAGANAGSPQVPPSQAGSPAPTGPSARPNPPVPTVQAMASPKKTPTTLPPIPKVLSVTKPVAVTVKPERPTLLLGSSISSPALTTPALINPPTFDIGENRVLGKRKLRELVLSVIGLENEGMIDGDVEETLFDAADEFVTSVTSFACRLAKHRKSDKLESKDLQLHLERNWNIRIPGHSADEVRSIRRIAPISSYNQKVSGVKMNKSVDNSTGS